LSRRDIYAKVVTLATGEQEDTMPAKRKPRLTRRGRQTTFNFIFRCPRHLIGPLNEARHVLREPTRSSLVTKALTEYLLKRGLWPGAA
jgi:hypothetical protein